jgi:hypothetical protein
VPFYSALHILQNAAFITCLVMTLMLLVEYVNATARARSLLLLKRSAFGQLLAAALLGMIPGCVGGFAVVALFTRGVASFGALVAAMVAAMGDEAFVMYASFPLKALALQGILLALALAAGGAANLLWGKKPAPAYLPASAAANHHHHHHHYRYHCEKSASGGQGQASRRVTFRRVLLAVGLLLFMAATASGVLGHAHGHGGLLGERHINLLFLAVAAAALVVVVRADGQLLERHLWRHVVKKHFVRILLWTLGSLVLVAVLNRYVEAQAWVRGNLLYMYAAAMLIGLVPASGPHLVFVLLFAQGNLPFSVLLANTIMQDGHAGIPLLANSRRSFIRMKAAKAAIAAVAAACGMIFGF